jgi:hypothetical protein
MTPYRPSRSRIPVRRTPMHGGSDSGYGLLGYAVIAGVVLLILAGGALLVALVVSSMSDSGSVAKPTSSTATCSSSEWLDVKAGTCVPRPVCADNETYRPLTNTCEATPPRVVAIAPTSGLTIGGTDVRISGTGFADGATVTVDGVPAGNVEVVSDSTITATTPGSPNLYPVDVTVTNPDGTSAVLDNSFTYVAEPVKRVTAVQPDRGSSDGGEAVIVKGRGFVDGVRVAFGGREATEVRVLNPTTLRVTTPAGAVGPVSVNARNPNEDPYVLTDGFTYANQAPRVVAGVRPAKGAQSGRTKVTISGTGFARGATVSFGGKPATKVDVVSSTRITAVTPAGPVGPVAVGVRNPGKPVALLDAGFSYIEAPAITGVRPVRGPVAGGTKVTITGTGFLPGAKVTIGGGAASAVKVVSDSSITAVTPPGKAGAVTVVVTNAGQPPASAKKAFTYAGTVVVVPEPSPSPKPTVTPVVTPPCPTYRLPGASTTAGKALTLGASAIFPASSGIEDGSLTTAVFVGDNGDADGAISWKSSPARIVWQPGAAGASGTVQFSYIASSCTGVGSGSVSFSAR